MTFKKITFLVTKHNNYNINNANSNLQNKENTERDETIKKTKLRLPWTEQEDKELFNIIKNYDYNSKSSILWSRVSNKMTSLFLENKIPFCRTGKQCRERWFNHLNANYNKGPWTVNEEKYLFDLNKNFGNRWAEISVLFYKKFSVKRTDSEIKNYYYSALRKKIRYLRKQILKKKHVTKLSIGSDKLIYEKIKKNTTYLDLDENKILSSQGIICNNNIKDSDNLTTVLDSNKNQNFKINNSKTVLPSKFNTYVKKRNSKNLLYNNLKNNIDFNKELDKNKKYNNINFSITKDTKRKYPNINDKLVNIVSNLSDIKNFDDITDKLNKELSIDYSNYTINNSKTQENNANKLLKKDSSFNQEELNKTLLSKTNNKEMHVESIEDNLSTGICNYNTNNEFYSTDITFDNFGNFCDMYNDMQKDVKFWSN